MDGILVIDFKIIVKFESEGILYDQCVFLVYIQYKVEVFVSFNEGIGDLVIVFVRIYQGDLEILLVLQLKNIIELIIIIEIYLFKIDMGLLMVYQIYVYEFLVLI